MSKWTEIDDSYHVNYDKADKTINVLYDYDDFGNNYITIPLAFIIEELEKNGYKVTKEK